MNKVIIIGEECPDAPCEYCGKSDELRPYGKGGAKICFDCAMLPENKAIADEAIRKLFSGESELPIPDQVN